MDNDLPRPGAPPRSRGVAPFVIWLGVIGLCLQYGRDLAPWFQGARGVWTAWAMGLAGAGALALSQRLGLELPSPRRKRAGGRLLALAAGAALLAWVQPNLLVRTHLLLYGVLGVLAYRMIQTRRGGLAGAGLALAICVLTGCLDEAIQYLHPQRVGDLADAALNAASAAVAILALLCLEPDRPRPTSAR